MPTTMQITYKSKFLQMFKPANSNIKFLQTLNYVYYT